MIAPTRLLARFGQLQLLIDAFRRISELPDPVYRPMSAPLWGWRPTRRSWLPKASGSPIPAGTGAERG
ncbi:MAG: hypothetical protein IPL59_24965 [Candidatus Competibacteraceae bacterium]|nr:hypothetical protein [Candidatus Competibacteraceae bacterium]